MTEAEWLGCEEVGPALEYLRERVSDRKLRLYLCGGCRNGVQFHSTESTEALDLVERFADGLVSREDISHASWIAESPTFGYEFQTDFWEERPERRATAVGRLVELGAVPASALSGGELVVDESIRHRLIASAELVYVMTFVEYDSRTLRRATDEIAIITWPRSWLRDCVFGNPFHPVSFSPEWLTTTAVALAQGMYDNRDFSTMPILADALQDAGCDNADILDHCRGSGPHVRGCWVVDRILGKT